MRRWALVGLVIVVILLALMWTVRRATAPAVPPSDLAVSALAHNPDVDPGTALNGRQAPNFVLTNQFGQRVSLRQFRGDVVILAFVDAECTTICPLTTTSMTEALGMLGPAAAHVRLVGIDANPTATTVSDVRSYSVVHGVLHQWNFLTGSPAALRRVWRAYGIYVAIVHGQIDHTPALYVIDRSGRERWVYMTQMSYAGIGQQAQVLAHAVANLLPGHPPVRSHLSYQWIRGETPAVSVEVPLVGGGTTRLGPATPHLVLFMASWLSQTSNLSGELDALNQYQTEARALHLPPLVAVDEATTEPSSAALAITLARLPAPLRYPVAIDESGRLADGYGVQGLPWYVLTSTRGTILWQASTWVPVDQLIAHVQAALARHRVG
jgi:cytochrome oxidase Cu insertion factor (SCO1/SenC/PrrC family)